MKKIAIDIDDVLACGAEGFVGYSNKFWGTKFCADDYDEDFAKLWGIDNNQLKERMKHYFSTDTLSGYIVKEKSLESLIELKKHYKLKIVTSRNSMFKDMTYEWLDCNFPNIFLNEDVHFSGIFDSQDEYKINKTKKDIIKELDVDYFIDDQLKHCLAVSELGIDVILFGDYKWNQKTDLPQNVSRIHNWEGVLNYFKAK